MSILTDIDEAPRPQRQFPETLAVGAQGDFVVDAGGHVTEMRRRNVLLHDRFEVEDVQRLGGIGDQLVGIARRPLCRVGRTDPFRHGAAREQRARGQELQETAAAGALNMMRRHRCPHRRKGYSLNSRLPARCVAAPCQA
jgi:hypothetical protein